MVKSNVGLYANSKTKCLLHFVSCLSTLYFCQFVFDFVLLQKQPSAIKMLIKLI